MIEKVEFYEYAGKAYPTRVEAQLAEMTDRVVDYFCTGRGEDSDLPDRREELAELLVEHREELIELLSNFIEVK